METRYGSGQYMIESLLPDYYWQSDFVNQFMMSLGVEADYLFRLTAVPSDGVAVEALAINGLPTPLETIVAAWFVRLASGTKLNYWEEFLGIPSNIALTDSERQATILNQLRNRGQSPTVQYINSLVQRHVQQSITQDEWSDPTLAAYTFRVRIIQPRAILPIAVQQQIQADLNVYAPQHMSYTITWTESDYPNLANHSYVDMGNMSWSTLGF